MAQRNDAPQQSSSAVLSTIEASYCAVYQDKDSLASCIINPTLVLLKPHFDNLHRLSHSTPNHATDTDIMATLSTSFNLPSPLARRSSIGSRLSFAVSNAEQEEEGLAEAAVVQPQIEEEIAEIKRYEVC